LQKKLQATRPRFNNRFLQGEDGEAGRGYGGHVQKEELDDGEEQPPFGMMDVSLSGEGFPKEAAISASFSDRQQNDAYEMHQLNLMNGSTSNQLQQQQQVSTLLDVEPFGI
jgi:hypothetical protein